MKTKIISLLLLAMPINIIFSQGNCEIVIENKVSSRYLYVKVYPVSMVFNGAKENNAYKYCYNLVARNDT